MVVRCRYAIEREVSRKYRHKIGANLAAENNLETSHDMPMPQSNWVWWQLSYYDLVLVHCVSIFANVYICACVCVCEKVARHA